jgi:primosomal protein N'
VIFDDFQFQHVLFLPKDMPPAYPNMGIKDLEKQGSFEAALQAALQPFTVTAVKAAKTDAEMTALGIHPEKKSNKEEIQMNQPIDISPDPKDLKIQELDKTVKELQAKLEESKTQAQKTAELEARVKASETFQAAVSKREHDTLVASVLETEKQASQLADDKATEEEKKRLDTFSDETLRVLQATHSRTAAFLKTLPPAKKPEEFDEKQAAAFEDIQNTEHRRLFGHGHDKEGKEVP